MIRLYKKRIKIKYLSLENFHQNFTAHLRIQIIDFFNFMSINWKPFPTFELYRDYSEILKINYEELNTLFINQFKDDIVFSFVPNLLLFCVSLSIFILLNAKLRIYKSIKNNLYRNYNLLISQTMNRILILMIPLSILFSYMLFLPRSYGVLAPVWRPEIVDHKLLKMLKMLQFLLGIFI